MGIRILVDADCVLELFVERGGYVEDAENLLVDMIQSPLIELHVIEKCLDDVYFYRIKLEDVRDGEEAVAMIQEKLHDCIVEVDRSLIEEARTTYTFIKDLDSAIEVAYAIKENLGAIVTFNPDNFRGANLPVLSVQELSERHDLEQIIEENHLPFLLNIGDLPTIQKLLEEQLQQQYSADHDPETSQSSIFEQTERLTFTVPLGITDFRVAKQFSSQQKLPAKARQVYLNTLAVRAVNFYCHCLKVETDLEGSYSWDINLRILMDVADLVVKHSGRLECRPVLSGEDVCQFPLEVWSDRIGYVVVEIDEAAKEAKLRGFVKEVETEELPLSKLPDLEDLVDFLHLAKTKEKLEPLLNQHWDATEKILVSSGRKRVDRKSVRSSEIKVSKAKSIKLKERELALIIEMEQESDEKFKIIFEVRPLGEIKSLPPGLELALLSPSDKLLTSKQAKPGDNLLEIKASMQLEKLESLRQRGKLYTVEVKLKGESNRENFPSISQ